MKKFECPYCHEKTISRVKKAFAGSLKSKGIECPNCGGRCVNGKQSSVFHSVVMAIVFAVIVYMVVVDHPHMTINAIALFALAFIVNKLFDALFFELDKTWRNDA